MYTLIEEAVSTEEVKGRTGMNQQERNYIKTLEKRMRHLEERIARSDKQALHYDEMERVALRWTIKMARQHVWVQENWPSVADLARIETEGESEQ